MTFTVRRRPGAPELPSQEHWANTPSGERKYISSEEFTPQYGAVSADLDLIAQFADSQGLQVVEKSAARRTVVVSGKVSNIDKAFAVELAGTRSRGGPKKNTNAAKATKGAASKNVRSTADMRAMCPPGGYLAGRRRCIRLGHSPQGPSSHRSLPYNYPSSPASSRAALRFPKPPDHIGKETIGLPEFSDPVIGTSGYLPTDINAYFTTFLGIGPGFVTPTLTDIDVNGATNSPGGPDDAEVALDIEVAGAVAQGAPIAVYFTT